MDQQPERRMRRKEDAEIIQAAADHAVKKTFAILGVDIGGAVIG